MTKNSTASNLEIYYPAASTILTEFWALDDKGQASCLLYHILDHALHNNLFVAEEVVGELLLLSNIIIQQDFLDSENEALQRLGILFMHSMDDTIKGILETMDIADPNSIPTPNIKLH